jgi:D-alanyl-D-alanine dipeptidase
MLLVWDAYRPLAVQQALFDSYVSELEGRGMAHDQAVVDAQRFVSIPSTDQTKPPPHNTGGSVDLTIIRFNETDWREMERLAKASRTFDRTGDWKGVYASEMRRQQLIREASTPLDMGTVFDGVQQETATRFYEDMSIASLDDVAHARLLNRRLLWNVMTQAGLSNYPDEWWHYDFGNQFDSARTGRKAVYGSVILSAENEAWEKMRREHYLGNVFIADQQRAPKFVGKLGANPLYTFVRDLSRRTGHMGYTAHPQAAGL